MGNASTVADLKIFFVHSSKGVVAAVGNCPEDDGISSVQRHCWERADGEIAFRSSCSAAAADERWIGAPLTSTHRWENADDASSSSICFPLQNLREKIVDLGILRQV